MSLMTPEQKYVQRQIADALRPMESRLAQVEKEVRRLKSSNQQLTNTVNRLRR